MGADDFSNKVASLVREDCRFSAEAYYFISEAVSYTISKLSEHRHVSGAELLDGIREFAVRQFGAVAERVLAHWGMIREDDAGAVVFLLIGVGLLRASESDSPADFQTGNKLIPALPAIRTVRRKCDKLPFIDV